MSLVPENINEAIKHLPGIPMEEIQQRVNGKIKSVGYRPEIKTQLINAINYELRENKRRYHKRPVEFLSNDLNIIRAYIRDNWQVTSQFDPDIIETLLYPLEHLIAKYELNKVDEGIKHLSPKSEKEIHKGIEQMFSKCDKFDMDMIEDDEQGVALRKAIESINAKDLRFSAEIDENADEIFDILTNVITIVNNLGYVQYKKPVDFYDNISVFPEEKLVYYEGGMAISYWFFDYDHILKNINTFASVKNVYEAYDYHRTYLQIYKNNDKKDFYNYIVLKGSSLFNVRLVKGEKWTWKYIGEIDKDKYIINGQLVSNPSMKLIAIFQKYLKK